MEKGRIEVIQTTLASPLFEREGAVHLNIFGQVFAKGELVNKSMAVIFFVLGLSLLKL